MDKRGLTDLEAEKKLKIYGYNELKDTFASSPLKIIARQVKKNFIIYLLFVAMILSFVVDEKITSFVILAVILLIVFTGFIQEYKAEKAIQSLKKMLTPISTVIRDGKEKEIPSRELVPGDIIMLRSGEKIPADCTLLENNDLIVNESALTGESAEVAKKTGKKISDENTLFMGTFILNGKCLAEIVKTGMNTKFGNIAKMISKAEKELPLQNKINRISKYMAVIAIIFSFLTGLMMIIEKGLSPTLVVNALMIMIALAVSAFPEGFPVVLITALSSGAYKMAQKNAIVNRMSIIETLGETTVICSDKTGTITKGEMTANVIFTDNNLITITGSGYENNGNFLLENKKINPDKNPTLDLLLKSSVICNESRIEKTGEDNLYKISGSPTEAALLIMASKAGIHREDIRFKIYDERPFDSQRKMMSVFCKMNKENFIFSKGAPEILIKKCKKIQKGKNLFTLTEREKERILNLNKGLTTDALRTIAIAYKRPNSIDKKTFEEDLIFLGIVGIEDLPRDEVKDSISSCLKAGIKVKMITGDHRETAIAIGKKIGLVGKVLEGTDLDKLSEKQLSKIVDDIVIFARVRPEHKIKIVRALKANGEIVTMTGDGVNDAPALKEAHIGVAMGKNGTDVSREVSDLILKDDNFATIVVAIREGRTIFKNVRKFVSYQLSCNYAELMVLFLGVLLSPILGWQIPILLALQILFMNLVTDDLPAIMLGFTPSSTDIMEEKPRKKKTILNKSLTAWFVIAGILMALITLVAFFISSNILHKSIEFARTDAMLTLIFVEIGNAFNFISLRRTVSLSSLRVNKYLLSASVVSIIASIIIIYSPLNKVFGTVPITLVGWLIPIISAILIILIFNILKKVNEKKKWFKLENF